jgi:phage terminase small subunit
LANTALKDKQEAFVLAYIGEARFNASEAARIAGFDSPGQQGYRLLKNVQIRARIDKYLEVETLNAKEVLAELTDVAKAPFRDYIEILARNEKGEPIRVKMDLSSKVKSLELLGKHHKLFTDNVEVGAAESFLTALREFGRGRNA